MTDTEVQEFWIGSFRYRLLLRSPGAIALLLMGGYSRKVGDLRNAFEEYDPFQKWEDYDPDDFALTGDEDLGVDVFSLKRECVNRIAGWVNRARPGFFSISPSTDRKEPLYDRISQEVASKIRGYTNQKINRSYQFYRQPL